MDDGWLGWLVVVPLLTPAAQDQPDRQLIPVQRAPARRGPPWSCGTPYLRTSIDWFDRMAAAFADALAEHHTDAFDATARIFGSHTTNPPEASDQ